MINGCSPEGLTKISKCEVCGSNELEPVLNLGTHPLCDDLVKIGDPRENIRYPIEILYCQTCRTAHQKFQVDKTLLFPKTYHYRSSLTKDVLNGMESLVERCQTLLGDLSGKRVLDVGCNDGSLLNFFRDKGCLTYGIDPTDAAVTADERGHEVHQGYLDTTLAKRCLQEWGSPDLITFTNVFAHIEDLPGLLQSLGVLMGETGSKTLVIENHYLGSILDGNQFDTFYQEHPRTYSMTSFKHIAKSLGGRIVCAEFPKRYGGNIRVVIQRDGELTASSELQGLVEKESRFDKEIYQLSTKAQQARTETRDTIEKLVSVHGKLRAKAFPGRAAILLEYFDLDETHFCVVHEQNTSPKVGHYVPGTRIPILADSELDLSDSRPIVNFAWHIQREISSYLKNLGYAGEVVPILSL